MYQKIENQLKHSLSMQRFEHSLRVADFSKKLAQSYGLNENSAYLAGLIHDCAKEINPLNSELVFDESCVAVFKEYPKVWHALELKAAANQLFDSLPEEVLDAAKWHTTGCAAMSALAECVYIADAIEPGRNYNDREILETLAFANKNARIFEIVAFSIQQQLNKKQKIHPETINCYNYYLLR